MDDKGQPVVMDSDEKETPEGDEDTSKAEKKPQKRAKRNTKDAKSTQ